MKYALICAVLAATPAIAQDAPERTVIEDLIAAQNPCASLKTKIAGLQIGIDNLDDLALDSADVSLIGDDVALSFHGRLACKTSSAAAFKGSASSAIDASAQVSLADCDKASVQVALSDFGGTFAAAVLQALQPVLEQQIAQTAQPSLSKACGNLLSKDK